MRPRSSSSEKRRLTLADAAREHADKSTKNAPLDSLKIIWRMRLLTSLWVAATEPDSGECACLHMCILSKRTYCAGKSSTSYEITGTDRSQYHLSKSCSPAMTRPPFSQSSNGSGAVNVFLSPPNNGRDSLCA